MCIARANKHRQDAGVSADAKPFRPSSRLRHRLLSFISIFCSFRAGAIPDAEKITRTKNRHHSLSKPFAFAELIARVEALLLRQGLGAGSVLTVAGLELDLETRIVRRGSKSIHLTAKEFSLLELLMRNKNRILTRRAIAEQDWGYTLDTGTNVVDVYVNYLRKAIDEGFPNRLIRTVRGVGFTLTED